MAIWFTPPTVESLKARSADTLVDHVGIEFLAIEDNAIQARMPVDRRTVQPAGILHGGASVVLAETLGSIAANFCIDPQRKMAVGLEINANHVRSVREGFVTGTVTPLHIGSTTQLWQIHIRDDQDRLVCVSRITMAVLDRHPADRSVSGGGFVTLPLRSVIVMLVLVLAAAVAGAGSIYRWVDQDGVVHYGNEAPQGGAIGDIQTRPEVESSSAAASTSEAVPGPESSATPPAAAPRQTVDVEIYTTSWCGYCREAKQYFRSRGIAFREFDVEKDPAAARRLKRYNPRGGVPVTVIDGQPIIGYAPAAFASALAK